MCFTRTTKGDVFINDANNIEYDPDADNYILKQDGKLVGILDRGSVEYLVITPKGAKQ